MTRDDSSAAFLAKNGYATASRHPLAGDASARRYERLSLNGKTFVLMDDPSDTVQSISSFLSMTHHLRQLNLSAPEVLAADISNGFLLLEDLGDAIFAREIERAPALEDRLYSAATELSLLLKNAPLPAGIPTYGPTEMAQAVDLAFLWYQPNPQRDLPEKALEVIATLQALLADLNATPTLSLRDYHAENLIWLPERAGIARVGLLDYQDAVATHPIYDLVSLIRDARRDVPPKLAQHCLSRFAASTGITDNEAQFAAALIAVQRNLRILGIFARLSRQHNKPSYVDLIPRVWQMLEEDLQHPGLQVLRDQLTPLLPQPTADFLNELRTPCPTLL